MTIAYTRRKTFKSNERFRRTRESTRRQAVENEQFVNRAFRDSRFAEAAKYHRRRRARATVNAAAVVPMRRRAADPGSCQAGKQRSPPRRRQHGVIGDWRVAKKAFRKGRFDPPRAVPV